MNQEDSTAVKTLMHVVYQHPDKGSAISIKAWELTVGS